MIKQMPTTSIRDVKKIEIQKHPFELVEYFSLGAAAAGTLAIGLSGQLIQATVGSALTLGLWANMANRQRLQQETQQAIANLEQKTVTVVVKLRQQLLAEIGALSHQLQDVASRSSFNAKDFDVQLNRLHQMVLSLQTNTENALADMRDRIVDEPPTSFIPEFYTIQTSIEQLQQTTNHLQEIVGKPTEIDQTLTRLSILEETITSLQETTNDLQQQNREVIKPYIKRLGTIIKQIQVQEGDEK